MIDQKTINEIKFDVYKNFEITFKETVKNLERKVHKLSKKSHKDKIDESLKKLKERLNNKFGEILQEFTFATGEITEIINKKVDDTKSDTSESSRKVDLKPAIPKRELQKDGYLYTESEVISMFFDKVDTSESMNDKGKSIPQRNENEPQNLILKTRDVGLNNPMNETSREHVNPKMMEFLSTHDIFQDTPPPYEHSSEKDNQKSSFDKK
jgi:hypothetical protein